jgi:phage gpG-like protein
MTPKQFADKMRKLSKTTIDKELMDEIASKTTKNVQTRTRKGFGVDTDGSKATKLEGLSESYKKQRKRLRKQGKLDSTTSPSKSNLTKSGDMLKDITYKTTENTATIFIGNNKGVKKAKYQDKVGRKFMNLSKNEIKEIEDIVDEKIQKDIKKIGL